MQIKITMKYHRIPVGMVIIKRTKVNEHWEDVDKREHLCAAGSNVSWNSHCGKQHEVSTKKKKIKIELQHDPVIPLWFHIYEIKSLSCRNTPTSCSLQYYSQWLRYGRK